MQQDELSESKMLNGSIRALMRAPLRLHRRRETRKAVERLLASEVREIAAVGRALHETIKHVISTDEKALISSIERRRNLLLLTEETIPVIDYGAGDPDSNRSREEMMNGVQTAASVSGICAASKPEFWGTFLFKLIRMLRPSSCVELGTCLGISAAYQAAALSLNGRGRLLTLEGSPEISRLAMETLAGLGFENTTVVTGPFHETFRGVLETAGPVDFFFNDGHHDHDAFISYFNEILPYLSDDAVIVFDDISWSPGMRLAWTAIEEDERVAVSVDLHAIGIAVISRAPGKREHFRIPL
jgi:predicted O-methyltransferase YrrM